MISSLIQILSFLVAVAPLLSIAHGTERFLETLECKSWCKNGRNCGHKRCAGCEFTCGGQCEYSTADRCGVPCGPSDCELPWCTNCLFCGEPKGLCPLGSFIDKTESYFSADTSYWNQWKHSGKPYPHEGPPVFFDINGDNILDYFHSLHGHTIDENGFDRMELARTTPNEKFVPITDHLIIEDNPDIYDKVLMDPHNEVIMDLDGDGLDDIYIVSGGNRGEPYSDPEELDNFLLFGEERVDQETNETSTYFVGGRERAMESGVGMRYARGRFSYIFDANGDGLLDIFTSNSRRVDNELAPGVLLINQGNRTWAEDRSMMEFTSTMLLTDADGDGLAQEIMVARDFCFPKRRGPGDNTKYGAFTNEVNDFCSTRPVGSMAVYKWNSDENQMNLISTPYERIDPGEWAQPACCPHGSFDGERGCSAVSMTSGDFDKDGIADHIILHEQKLVFYFSTDRRRGDLPIGKQNVGLVIQLPNQCSHGKSVKVIDMANSGESQIMVICRNAASFLIYTQGNTKTDWTLDNDCNNHGSLGDLVEYSLAAPDKEPFEAEACKDQDTWGRLKKICKGRPYPTRLSGVTLADFNNDGFVDAAVSYNFGYQRFFLQNPNPSFGNRQITFKIIGDGKNNVYGIGASMVLISHTPDGTKSRQFKEVSSHQHTSDKTLYQDPRIIFGLGENHSPNRLVIKWPNGQRQVVYLKDWEFIASAEPINIRYYLSEYLNFPFFHQQIGIRI